MGSLVKLIEELGCNLEGLGTLHSLEMVGATRGRPSLLLPLERLGSDFSAFARV